MHSDVRGILRHTLQRRLNRLPAVMHPALAHFYAQEPQLVPVARKKLVIPIVRTCNDHHVRLVELGEQLDRALKHRPTAEVLIQLAPHSPRLAVPARRPRRGNDDSQLHPPMVPDSVLYLNEWDRRPARLRRVFSQCDPSTLVHMPHDSHRSDSDASGAYLRPYELAVEQFGPSFEATLWLSRDAQQKRFGVIAAMVDLTGAHILDAGCGMGDFAQYLHRRSIDFASYVGLEGIEKLVDAATARGLERARFALSDFVDDAGAFVGHFPDAAQPDVIVFSGSLNTLKEKRARIVLDRAWNAANRALVFNFLSKRNGQLKPKDPSPARRYDPLAMLDWALCRTPNVQFRQDYLAGHDATVAMLTLESVDSVHAPTP